MGKPCPFCGSLATEWEEDTLLGCEDCGYDQADEHALGPCGCIDYHMADCPLLTDR